jgi:hypothetical protein
MIVGAGLVLDRRAHMVAVGQEDRHVGERALGGLIERFEQLFEVREHPVQGEFSLVRGEVIEALADPRGEQELAVVAADHGMAATGRDGLVGRLGFRRERVQVCAPERFVAIGVGAHAVEQRERGEMRGAEESMVIVLVAAIAVALEHADAAEVFTLVEGEVAADVGGRGRVAVNALVDDRLA